MRARWIGLLGVVWTGCQPPAPAVAPGPLPSAAQAAQSPPLLSRGVFVPGRSGGPALGLTASDGTGLRLVALSAHATAVDPLAFTELRLVFENPSDRTLEGTFRVVLPQGASVSRFAMHQEDRWQEGEVVETQAARQAYEDFLHRKQDPALLEQAAGNEFSARVFPIPARGRKELIVSYSQEIGRGAEGYRLPLGGLPEIEQIEVEVYQQGQLLGAMSKQRFTPEGDFALDPSAVDRSAGLRSGDLVLARVAAVAEARPDPIGSALFLVDTSASRALGFEAQLRLLADLIGRAAQADGASSVAVVAFDQTRELVYEGPASGFGAEALEKLRTRGALGASDLGEALGWAGSKARERGLRRLVLLSDGVATEGESDTAKLRQRVAALKGSVERLDVVATGGIRDDAALRRLATAGLDRDGVVADGAQPPEALFRRLTQQTRSGVPVRVEGARWWWPRSLDGVQHGDETLVYAEVPAAQGAVSVSVGDRTLSPQLASTERPLLERAWAKAKIQSLLEQEKAEPDEVRRQVLELSTRHRVLSPFTSLLVLETDDDYRRFHIDRTALADILTLRQGRLALDGRSRPPEPMQIATSPSPETPPTPDLGGSDAPASPAPPDASPPATAAPAPGAAPPDPARRAPERPARPAPPPTATAAAPRVEPPRPAAAPPREEPKKEDKAGEASPDDAKVPPPSGGVGSLGHGAGTGSGQGFGVGHGRLGGSHSSAAPQVRMGATSVSGRLPPEVIQRIVRQNFGRFRLCYENGLRQNPGLQGRVSVRFVIDRNGEVAAASNAGSTLPDPGVASCVVRSFQNLHFPQPEAGIVTVVYPISFSPSGEVSSRGGVSRPEPEPAETPAVATPYHGHFKEVMDALATNPRAGLTAALAWHGRQPGDILALVALGEAYEGVGAKVSAARAYGSLIDLFPARADLRRYAAARMERLGADALPDAIDSLRRAREQRPDHPASHRMLAMALLRKGAHAEAFKVLEEGLARRYPQDRFAGHERILREDLGLVAAAWIKAEPPRRAEIERRRKEAGGSAEEAPSLRFVLTWETDANDVDFHIYDSKNGHAFYGRPRLKSGGELYADVTTGYGPECFTIRKPRDQRLDYTLQAHYYSRGPMGYGMGKLEVIDHDGKGNLTFEERPFVVMEDGAFIDLGKVSRK